MNPHEEAIALINKAENRTTSPEQDLENWARDAARNVCVIEAMLGIVPADRYTYAS
jgi:hypothetical protein